jgi:glycosyltransferase involved in cell wall biosynthesis
MPLPKVLIVGQPFNNTGGGITMTNLFKGWDPDKLAVACVGAMANIDTIICHNYYRLGNKERTAIFPFNYLQTEYVSGQLEPEEKKKDNPHLYKPTLRTRLIMKYFFPFLKFIGISHFLFKTDLSPEFTSWIKRFKPDVLYAQASSREGLLFCTRLSSYLKIPFIFHMMDDWPEIISDKGLFKRYWHKKIDSEFRRLLDKADALMSIGDLMSSEYKIRYNKTFIPFQNPINIEFWRKHQKNSYGLNKPTEILYAGRIGLGINESIKTFALALQLVNNESPLDIKLVLHTDIIPSWISGITCVEHRALVQHSEVPELFSKADFLLLPYDFTPKSIKYIKYSMPTKAPEYMISGTPMIIFAPEETAIVQYAMKNEIGFVISENKVSGIAALIRQLIDNKELRSRIGQKAVQIAELNHNSNFVNHHFRTLICSVASGTVAEKEVAI